MTADSRVGRSSRTWPGLLLRAAAGLGLAYPAFGYVRQEAPPWRDGVVRFELQLGAASGLLDGSASWDDAARAALDIWNQQMGRLRLEGVMNSTAPIAQANGRNNVFFSDQAFGRDFGDRTLAITFSRWSTRRTEADIVFNQNVQWNSYRGRLRSSGGKSLADLRRVALHEFGHALGLDHPDDEGQTVTSVMNATVGHLDTLAADDISGVQAIYGAIAAPAATDARLVNLSVRSRAGSGGRTLIAGFVTSEGQTVLIRGIGPGLVQHKVPDPLRDPSLTLFRGNTVQFINDDWDEGPDLRTTFQATGAFALQAGSSDAAFRRTLTPGPHSVHLSDRENQSGVGLIEVYAANAAGESGRLLNLSARTQVGTGADVLIIGFVLEGNGASRLLVRGVGPTLRDHGVDGVLADPEVRVFQGSTEIATNDDWWWNATEVAAAGLATSAFPLRSNSRDAALVVRLEPGAYTVQVSGVGNTTGVGLVELYLVP